MLDGFFDNVSVFASDVDRAFWVSTTISIVMFVLVIGFMFFFAFKYHHSRVKDEDIENIEDHIGLEVAWTVIPTLLLMVIFYYGYTSLQQLRTMPEDAFNIEVLGKRWSWTFTYPNGKVTSELYVPKDKNILLTMTAPVNDVLHSFYVPVFRTKEDVIPGRESKLWFNATKIGRYDVECAEYCGTRHSFMLTKVDVMEQENFDDWYGSDKRTPYEKKEEKSEGAILFESLGCNGCHSMDGSVIVGPSLKDLDASEQYIKDAIMTPNRDIAEGFPPDVMPDMSAMINEKQLVELVKFIKGEDKVSLGEVLFEQSGCTGCHSIDESTLVGPGLKGVFNKERVFIDGTRLIADEAYLKNSILRPNEHVVEGFSPGIMTSFETILKEEEVDEIVNYIKALK